MQSSCQGYTRTKGTPCSTFEMYDKTPIFITMGIMEDVVELVTRKLLGSLGPGVMNSEALQGWILKFGEDSKKIGTSVEIIINWLSKF